MAIKEDPPLTIKEGGFIKESFNKELQEIKLVGKKPTLTLLSYKENIL